MVFTIRVEIYHSSIYCFVGSDEKEMRESLALLKQHYDEEGYAGMIDIDSCVSSTNKGSYMHAVGNDFIVYFMQDMTYGSISHEFLHVVLDMLRDRSVELGEGGESAAYLLGYIVDTFYDLLSRENKKEEEADDRQAS